jgi:hypothetical protein
MALQINVHTPDYTDTLKLYTLEYLDNNTFIFLVLDKNFESFLNIIFRKISFNYNLKEIDFTIKNKYGGLHKEILNKSVSFFNMEYSIDCFDEIYEELDNYSTLLYEINNKTDELLKFKKYNFKTNQEIKIISDNLNPEKINSNDNKNKLFPYQFNIIDLNNNNNIPIYRDDSTLYDNTINDYMSFNCDNYDYNDLNNLYNKNDNIFCIYYCESLNFSVVLHKNDYIDIIENLDFNNFVSNSLVINFIKEITIDRELVDYFEELFNNQFVESIHILNKQLELFEYTNDNSKKNNIELDRIKEYINRFYIINNSKEYKVKSSVLLEELCSSVFVKNTTLSMKNKLSSELQKLGLKKFRLSDGYYFYGLKKIEITK